jgi:acetylornithine deacetylase/succinyl-diaminopimelate desuccinylase-like protein
VLECFRQENLADVGMDAAGNVYARLPGRGEVAPLVVSAHLDTVFPAGTDLHVVRTPEQITAPGIGDNALGVAGLFALVWSLHDRQPLAGDLWLVANVAEEGLGDLRGMKAVVDRFGKGPQAYVVVEGMAFGQVYHRGLGVERYRIGVQTSGGHSWVDFGLPSAIHHLAELVTRLTALSLPVSPRTTLNVGTISGGTTVNTIAAEAHLELDLRSEDAAELARLVGQVQKVAAAANRPGACVTIEVIGSRPAGEIPADHPLIGRAVRCLEALGVTPRLNIGSTDANVPLSRGLPAVCIGLTSGSGSHTTHETIQTAPLAQGLAQLVMLVSHLIEK